MERKFLLRRVSIFTCNMLMISVLVPSYIHCRLPVPDVFYSAENSRCRVKVRVGVKPVYWSVRVVLIRKRFSKFRFRLYNLL
jgi:hypothetical protein